MLGLLTPLYGRGWTVHKIEHLQYRGCVGIPPAGRPRKGLASLRLRVAPADALAHRPGPRVPSQALGTRHAHISHS